MNYEDTSGSIYVNRDRDKRVNTLYRNIVLPQNEQMFRRMLKSQLLYLSQESREDGNE